MALSHTLTRRSRNDEKICGCSNLKKEEDEQVLAAGFNLEQNYPNPFNPVTHIKFNLKENEFTTLKIYDVLGNLVKTLLNQELVGGKYDISFDASELANGMYVYQLVSGNNVQSKKMILLK
ncbi:MAG TPA: T9SS type A sorting domain-containing protein [Ignavibacteriaceae bacterium]|nr:T9SS type A sorting domain-containing protein [Ignavibacteriaceae bacterium]